MSSAASPNSVGQSVTGQSVESSSAKSGLRNPPARPQLMGPPARPKPPVAPAPAPAAPIPEPEPEPLKVIGPISAPSERMQYRAIGMLKGKYIASEEQFNRGDIAVEDGTLVDAVLLGRVTSLIKKHIDLETDHVWVVYPRTLYSEENVPALHVQIVGVWEPETLSNRNAEASSEDPTDDDAPRYLTTEEAADRCDHFSIRGEIAKYEEEKEEITVNIVQKSKSEGTKPKRPFKLLICGTLTGRTVGYFWDLEVKREAGKLILQSSKPIAVVPPKRKPKNARKDTRRRPPAKPRSGSAPKPVPKLKTADKKAENDGVDGLSQESAVLQSGVDQSGVAQSGVAQKDAVQNGAVQNGNAIAESSAIADEQPTQVAADTSAKADTVSQSAESLANSDTSNSQ